MYVSLNINALVRFQNKKAELSHRWPCDAPYVWVPSKIFRSPSVSDCAHGYISWSF